MQWKQGKKIGEYEFNHHFAQSKTYNKKKPPFVVAF